MLELKEITKKYIVIPAVNKVSFTVKPSEILGYLGPNGAGKTTTLNMLAGLLEPTDGEIYFQSKNINDNIYDYKKRIGYVPEQSEIYPHLSAYDYLLMVGRLRHIPEKILREKLFLIFNIVESIILRHIQIVPLFKTDEEFGDYLTDLVLFHFSN